MDTDDIWMDIRGIETGLTSQRAPQPNLVAGPSVCLRGSQWVGQKPERCIRGDAFGVHALTPGELRRAAFASSESWLKLPR